jgi:DNA repair protein RadD
MQLRNYQTRAEADIHAAWAAGARNVMPVMPTGSGKTQLFSKMLRDHKGAAAAIAHRKELVWQISLTLARWGVHHRIVAPKDTVKRIVRAHIAELGESFYRASSPIGVAGVDTLLNRRERYREWISQVSLVVIDEGHHVLRENKWGRAFNFFSNARGLLVTATPERGDGKGLGRAYDGIVDVLVLGPSMRELIDLGHLAEYTVFCPVSTFDLSKVKKDSGTGDWNRKQLQTALEKSTITGDVVQSYLRFAKGKRGITFADCVVSAERIAENFRAAGVPALAVDADTPDDEREQATRDLVSGKLLQLVNVDLFGEGYDVPAVEVVSFCRPTESYSLYCQQFGRVLRPKENGALAIVIDHVGNIAKHQLPDAPHEWSLSGRGSNANSDAIPLRNCTECTKPYERFRTECPYCGAEPTRPPGVGGSALLEQIDGDLVQLTPEELAIMRAAVADNEALPRPNGNRVIHAANLNRHADKMSTQVSLRESMKWWAGYLQSREGLSVRETQKLFFLRFGVDVLGAQALPRKEANELATKINRYIGEWWADSC